MTSDALEDTAPAGRDSGPLVPARISRFEVRRTLGEGGNGVVLLARDPTLDRDVALKILRRRDDLDANQRLLREAQSAARLAHEAVIVVHEVGTHDGQVYVTMEYVAGGTLTAWQRGRSWRDVLAVYVRAGRGLAAAHAAGMVHRDFKPDNVLVGDDGRVRVTDFGLVSVSSGKPPDEVRDLELTKTGTVMGTPRYMAPEQHLGEAVDPRTDQFAFCVALYEALWQRAPFAGDTYGELADHVLAGDVVQPPGSDVPSRIRAAILRGLSRDPADRWPSMEALLAQLTPARRRRWILPAALAAVLAVAATVLLIQRAQRRETVRDAFDRAQAAYDRGDYAAAAAGFHRAFELDPELGDRGAAYVYNMAAAYEMLGDCREAVTGYRRYLALGQHVPDRATVEARLRGLGDCGPAQVAKAAYRLGEGAYERGDYRAAIEAFKRGFAADPNLDAASATYLFNLGQAYRQLGECANAAAAFRKFLALASTLTPARRAEIAQRITELDACAAQQRGSATR